MVFLTLTRRTINLGSNHLPCYASVNMSSAWDTPARALSLLKVPGHRAFGSFSWPGSWALVYQWLKIILGTKPNRRTQIVAKRRSMSCRLFTAILLVSIVVDNGTIQSCQGLRKWIFQLYFIKEKTATEPSRGWGIFSLFVAPPRSISTLLWAPGWGVHTYL